MMDALATHLSVETQNRDHEEEIREEVQNCIQHEREELWRTFLKKELKAMKESITKNQNLN